MFDATSFFIGFGFAALALLCIYFIVRCWRAERYIHFLQSELEKMCKSVATRDILAHIEKTMKDNDKSE